MSPVIVTLIIVKILLPLHIEAFYCYNCVSSLPSNISKDAKLAFKAVLYSIFMVPPVDRLCNNSEDTQFRTIKHINCSTDDQCVKITVQKKNLKFVMRGCEKFILRGQMIGNNRKCHSNESPSICRCNGNLCNGAFIFSLHNFAFFLVTFTTLLNFV